MPQCLYLARHGETDANFFKIIEGRGTGASPEYGNPLNNTGVVQAHLLGRVLAEVKIDHIYASPARRAVETANQICRWTNVRNLPLKRSLDKDLAEINFGILEGYNGEMARKKYPDLFKTYYKNPSLTFFPEGESIIEVYNRVVRAIFKIFTYHNSDENILIVSHGGVIAFIFVYIFRLDLDIMFHAIRHHNTGLSIIEWESYNPRIVCINDISHLKDEHARRLTGPMPHFLSA